MTKSKKREIARVFREALDTRDITLVGGGVVSTNHDVVRALDQARMIRESAGHADDVDEDVVTRVWVKHAVTAAAQHFRVRRRAVVRAMDRHSR